MERSHKTSSSFEEAEEALFLDALGLGNKVYASASGPSMLPFILPGARLLIEPPPFFSPPLAPGDLLLARSGGCLRLHRLIEERPDGFIIKGDAVLRADPLVLRQDLHGRVVAIEGRFLTRYPLRRLNRVLAKAVAKASRFQWRLLRRAMSGRQ